MKKRQRLGTVAVGMACAFFVTTLTSCDWLFYWDGWYDWKKDAFFDDNRLQSHHLENAPQLQYTDGYCNGRIFCATVESEEYFQSYAQSVYDYLWEKGLYLGQRGEVLNGLAYFYHYEFNGDVEKRALGGSTQYEFLYTAQQRLAFPEKEEQSDASTPESTPLIYEEGEQNSAESEENEENSSDQLYYYGSRGIVKGLDCFTISYAKEMQTMEGEGVNVPFEYNFKMEFPVDLGATFFADVDKWEEMINTRK